MSRILYGDWVEPDGTARVAISDLAGEGCRLSAAAATLMRESALWIGAVGPFPAEATMEGPNRYAVRFKQPLDGKIFDHFMAV